ncbi:hypothetical protein HN807_10930 [Candidatus Bathyarchaeota archaeon]|jgi:hypothetical protein|nr:hypothetical protein [Candidatus Bathyarchaeota archaeon]MBT4320925.1 hypothetical protein [Candidatus Bathyarchaeota archaeon]MBT4423198.1 hypothetical protein [Candidatus Bathyarchaeota archaeon]MBT5641549.1 hypothetical protein [Candidatus Bathyarchaeota archaeon]MBT6605939.1 hypothetical protein [Candidatus Bathyarchaeota archaeon]
MTDHPLSQILPSFDSHSYHAGINMAFSEVVGAGCKMLALSSTYSREYAEEMLSATRHAAEEYNTLLYIEPDLLVTKLFPKDVAKDKTVILIAHNQSVLDEYHSLKKLKIESDEKGNPDEIEDEIARRFGVLLSYDKATLERLLAKHG